MARKALMEYRHGAGRRDDADVTRVEFVDGSALEHTLCGWFVASDLPPVPTPQEEGKP